MHIFVSKYLTFPSIHMHTKVGQGIKYVLLVSYKSDCIQKTLVENMAVDAYTKEHLDVPVQFPQWDFLPSH